MAEKKSDPPFKVSEIQVDLNSPQNLVELFALGIVTFGTSVIEKFRGKLNEATDLNLHLIDKSPRLTSRSFKFKIKFAF